jgi:hypothetical protein
VKLSELRQCDGCGGPLVNPPNIRFDVVRLSAAVVIPSAANQVLGLTQVFHGALKLAETMAPEPEVVKLLGDESSDGWDELLLCSDCYFGPSLGRLHEILEGRRARLHEQATITGVPGP